MNLRFITAIAIAGCLTGCHSPGGVPHVRPVGAGAAMGFPRTLTDARGNRLTLPAPPRRIVSLIPSNTEVLYALGAGSQVAAGTSADDYPPEVKSKPNIGSAMTISTESVMAQRPDLVVGMSSLNQKPLAALDAVGVPTLAVEPKDIATTYESIRMLGAAAGHGDAADRVVEQMRRRLGLLAAAVAKTAGRPRVLIMYDTNPIYTSGPDSFISDSIRLAGGVNVIDRPLSGNIISSERVILARPDVIICGESLIPRVRRMPGWAASVPAVKNGAFFADRSTLVRPTPRLVDGIEALAAYLHPGISLKTAK